MFKVPLAYGTPASSCAALWNVLGSFSVVVLEPPLYGLKNKTTFAISLN